MNCRKTGRHYVYPNSFIIILSYIKSYFHLPYRQTEGLMKAVGKELPDNPSYSQMNRRINQLNVKLDKAKEKDGAYVIIAIDSTGINKDNK